MLAPPKYKTVCSYVIGWLTSLAWVATVATETLFAGTMIQGIVSLDYPDYDTSTQRWHGTLLTWCVICVCIFVNVVIPAWLPRFEVFILVFHIAGFFAILITLLVMTPELGSNASVWLTSLNEGGWPTQGVSYCVGFLGNVATFVGADASVHLAEEVSNPAVNIPKAIIGAMLINGSVGFAMMVTILYCLGDVDSVLNSKTAFPFIQIFFNSVGNIAGATVMAAVVLTLTWACSIGITTTASRMTWSFARDNGLPMSHYLSRVSSRTKVPVWAALAVTGIAALLTLIYIGSDTAFNDVISLTITGFYGSYLMPAAFLLYHRIKGNILPPGTEIEPLQQGAQEEQTKPSGKAVDGDGLTAGGPSKSSSSNPAFGHHDSDRDSSTSALANNSNVVINARLVWGPFRLPGLFGIINNLYACCYMVFVIFWSVWPPATPVTAATMNYSVVVTGGVMLLSAIWYFVRAKHVYKGPLIDSEVAEVMRAGSVVG
jgi:choline transport protein